LQELHKALFMGQPVGQTALYDAIALGLKQLETGHRDKRTLIVVSDGGDNVSELKQADIMNLILQSRATVYTIGLLDPEDRDLRPAVLKKFASISGGEYFQPEKLEDVISVLAKISKDIRSRYTIGFSPDIGDPNIGGNAKQIHSIKITATEEGHKLLVRARTAFTVDRATIPEKSLRDWR
jgi:VWFA-related protein